MQRVHLYENSDELPTEINQAEKNQVSFMHISRVLANKPAGLHAPHRQLTVAMQCNNNNNK